MDERFFYRADFRQLNRKAELVPDQGNSHGQARRLLGRIFPPIPQGTAPVCDPPLQLRLARALSAIQDSLNWDQDLAPAGYAAVDTETTGLHPFRGDEIMSVGVVLIEEGEILAEPVFHRLVNPRRSISPASKRITGISEEMLEGQPGLEEVLVDLLHFVGPRILVAHHAPFDLAFFNLKMGACIGSRIINPVIDTGLLATTLFPNLGDLSLENLAPRFGIGLEGRHTALGDALITARLFLKLLPRLVQQGVTTLPALARLFVETDQKPQYPLIF